MIRRLRFKFVLVNMGIVALMLCVIFGLVLYFTSAKLELDSIRMMQSIAEQPFHLNAPSETGEDVRLPFFTLELGPRGELVSTGGGYYDLSDDDFLHRLIDAAYTSPRNLGVLEEYNLRYYRTDSPLRPCLVFADISSEQATLEGLVRTCLLIGGCSFLAFLWISILLSRWAVRPVDAAWKRQRQFVAAASHELKTPLTVILTNAELLQDPDYDEGTRSLFLSNILTMSRQMRRLIEQMLELARADAAPSSALVPLDFSKLVSQSVLSFESVFFERKLHLTAQIAEQIQVSGEESALRQVLEILLDNAQKYSRSQGAAQVSLQRHGRDRCLLIVSNEGVPIPQEELGRIFERFYRADPARSRDGSFGLGLSIAESIVVRHQGRIWAESGADGNRFLVELPCTAP